MARAEAPRGTLRSINLRAEYRKDNHQGDREETIKEVQAE